MWWSRDAVDEVGQLGPAGHVRSAIVGVPILVSITPFGERPIGVGVGVVVTCYIVVCARPLNLD